MCVVETYFTNRHTLLRCWHDWDCVTTMIIEKNLFGSKRQQLYHLSFFLIDMGSLLLRKKFFVIIYLFGSTNIVYKLNIFTCRRTIGDLRDLYNITSPFSPTRSKKTYIWLVTETFFLRSLYSDLFIEHGFTITGED